MGLFRKKTPSKTDQVTPEYLLLNSRFKRSVHHCGTDRFHDYEEYCLYYKNRGLLFPISIQFGAEGIQVFGQRGAQMIVFKKLTIERFEKLMETLKK